MLVAVFVDVDDDGATPAEDEVAASGAERDSEAEPDVVGHEDEHEEVADDDLEDVQQRLDQVRQTQHRHSETADRHIN